MSQIPAKKFEAILRLLLSHLVAANVHLTIWEELRSTPDREKRSGSGNLNRGISGIAA